MPFDMSPPDPRNVLIERLALLLEICKRTRGAQDSFRTCLWAACRKDERMMELGLRDIRLSENQGPWNPGEALEFFSLQDARYSIWGGLPLSDKREIIDRRLSELRALVAMSP